MNTRGFTLVEVIAIMVVLVGIFLVSFPTLNNVINSDEEKIYDTMVEDLCIAGKTYLYSNLDSYPGLSNQGEKIEIEVNLLVKNKYVEENIMNPKTNVSINEGKLEYTVLEDLTLDCKYIEE